MKGIKKYSYLLSILIFSMTITYVYLKGKYNNLEIDKNGNYFEAIVMKKIKGGSRGSSYYLEYQYFINNSKIRTESSVSEYFFKKLKEGDTIIVRSTIINGIMSKICEDISYHHCFGKQPSQGWFAHPKCN